MGTVNYDNNIIAPIKIKLPKGGESKYNLTCDCKLMNFCFEEENF
jgi:hypothetical protein